jgi:hypothetical protein
LVTWAFTTPASTSARRFSQSTARIWFIRVSAIITPPVLARTVPLRLVPAPRGMTGNSCRAQSFTTAATSPVVRGSTTTPGRCFSSV